MKKILFFILFICASALKAQEYSSLNYFCNVAYYNPASIGETKSQVDFNSLSLYNNLPLGAYGFVLFGRLNTVSGLGGSVQYNSTLIGKVSSLSKTQTNLNYTTKLNFKHDFSFGLGFKSFGSIYDEFKLLTDLDVDIFEYSYGLNRQVNRSYQVPIGVSLKNNKVNVGLYYSKGISVKDSYGIYSKSILFETKIKEYELQDYIGFAFSKEFLNPKIAIDNMIEIDNYKIDVFYAYNLSSSSFRSYQSFGAGVYYNWHLFDIHYQIAFNNNHLGLSHQIGVQFFMN